MTTEEKAKRYDEALERARKCLDEKRDTCFVRPDVIFPELKESEDERIRKELITHFRNTKCVTEEGAKMIAKWIAWLEKQGKKKNVDAESLSKVILASHGDPFKKPKWSEEDDERFRDIIGAIHSVAYQTTKDEEARIEWLKSIKRRMED